MTVSRVVNRHVNISEETRQKVYKAIHELGYKPNTIARTLVAQRSSLISMLVPDIANPFFSQMIKAAEREVTTCGYSLMIADAGWDRSYETNFIDASIGRMSDGLILVTPRLSEQRIRELSKQVPIVVVDRFIEDSAIRHVYVDNYQGAYDATEYLIAMGHRRIGYIRGVSGVQNTIRREAGFTAAMKDARLPVDPELVTTGDYQSLSGYEAFGKLIDRPDRPTAVFASNDLMAYGLIQACREHGVRVPQQLSVIGFDDISLFIQPHPALTTVSHPKVAMIQEAVRVLLKEPSLNRVSTGLKNELIIRQTVCRCEACCQ